MSYDVSIGDACFNYTYNLSPFFHGHIPEGINSLHGMSGAAARDTIARALLSIDNERITMGEPAFRQRYDAPNGWGTVMGAIMFLAMILAACAANPRKKVSVS